MTPEYLSDSSKPSESEPQSQISPAESKSNTLEKAMKRLANNPRFKKAGTAGDGLVIAVGQR